MGLCIAGRWRSSSAASFSAPRPEPGRRGLHSVVSWRLAVTGWSPQHHRGKRGSQRPSRPWPFLSDVRRIIQKTLDIAEYTGLLLHAMFPQRSFSRPALSFINRTTASGSWFSPTLKELHHDLRAVLRKCWPDWAITPKLKAGRVYGRKHLFRREDKTYVQALSEQD